MPFEFDSAKDAINRRKHGLSLAEVRPFDREPKVVRDDRFDYGEIRCRTFGRVDGKPHCLIFTFTETGVRIISYRRAREKELRRYD
ncbi:BrnT family toxin [Sphingomonas sp.]|uniref:BrnT family toxin n=1 Tax=Sphingomonas sp. TaxID=28214 RepID=UPI00258C8209|nr:BrnT family toxin [Sphingomonas sp.]